MDGSGPPPEGTSRGRLFVRVTTQSDEGPVHRIEIIDLDDGTTVGMLPVGARIHPDPWARFGILDESRTEGRLRYVDPGIDLEDGAVVKREPSILSYETPSQDVLNVDVGTEYVGVFSDTGSVGRFVDTRPLPAAAPDVITIDRNEGLSLIDEEGPGGQAVQWGDSLFVSVVSEGNPPFPAGPMPIAIQRFSTSGEALEEYPCSGLGFASSGDYAAFSCAEGILELQREGTTITSRLIPYLSETTSCFQMLGAPETPTLLVMCSDANTFAFMDLLRLSVPAGELSSIPGTAGRWTTHLVGTSGVTELAYVERATGDVVVRGMNDGLERRRAEEVVAPFPAFPVSWSTVTGEFMYVGFVASNAPEESGAENEVLEIDLSADPPVVTRRFPVAGTPGRIEILGRIP